MKVVVLIKEWVKDDNVKLPEVGLVVVAKVTEKWQVMTFSESDIRMRSVIF
jgi:hypothetical protein